MPYPINKKANAIMSTLVMNPSTCQYIMDNMKELLDELLLPENTCAIMTKTINKVPA